MIFRRKPTLTDDAFISMYKTEGPQAIATYLQIHVRNVHLRRATLEAKLGVLLTPPESNRVEPLSAPERVVIPITDGVALIGGDGHYWPGDNPTAHRAFVKLAKVLKPSVVVFNGDALDFPRISRHAPIGWEKQPTVEDELAAVQERLGEIEAASRRAEKIWTLGNHDARFNTRLAMVASEYAGVPGTRLVHHFPLWTPAWAAYLGTDGPGGVVVKHRFKGGIHAPHNNTLWSGRSMVTGHLHSQKVMPITDYNGTRYGVDCGCIAAPGAEQFRNYTEESPQNWRSGFCVLTWKKGRLLPPELVSVVDEKAGHVVWRGDVLEV